MKETLKNSIANQVRNTPLGFIRIKRNLNLIHLTNEETEAYLKKVILSTPLEDIDTKGKNHYFKSVTNNAILTINSYTLTIITAKQIVKTKPVKRNI